MKVSNVIKGMDKRMSYNMRLMSSVVPDQEKTSRPNDT
jgi:hypothetical protein